MTDEFYVAVTEFNLSWEEIRRLSENSIRYSFLPEDEKARLLDVYRERISRFEKRFQARGLQDLTATDAPKRAFICTRYDICAR